MTDHVVNNKTLVSKIKNIRAISTIIRNSVEDQRQETVRQFVKGNERKKQKVSKLQLERWQQFCKRRQEVVIQFLRAKKKKSRAEEMVRHILFRNHVREFTRLFRQEAARRKAGNRAFWVKLQLLMNFKRALRRLTGENADGLDRRLCCYLRHSFIFATTMHFMRMEFIRAISKKEARSIYYLFAQKGKVQNLFNAITAQSGNLAEIEIKAKFYRVFDKEASPMVQAHMMVYGIIQ